MLSKLEIQCETGMHFSFSFGWYFIQLDIVIEVWGVGGGGCLTD